MLRARVKGCRRGTQLSRNEKPDSAIQDFILTLIHSHSFHTEVKLSQLRQLTLTPRRLQLKLYFMRTAYAFFRLLRIGRKDGWRELQQMLAIGGSAAEPFKRFKMAGLFGRVVEVGVFK